MQSRIANYQQMSSYSRDQQPAVMNVSVNYRINPGVVDEVYTDYGGELPMRDRLITPRVQQEVISPMPTSKASSSACWQKWNGVLPTTMLPSNTVPIINPLNSSSP